MIKLFALIAVINGHEYVVDSSLTQDDCHKAIQETRQIELWESTNNSPLIYNTSDIVAYCEEESNLNKLEEV